jgi:hypothetical protein
VQDNCDRLLWLGKNRRLVTPSGIIDIDSFASPMQTITISLLPDRSYLLTKRHKLAGVQSPAIVTFDSWHQAEEQLTEWGVSEDSRQSALSQLKVCPTAVIEVP